MICPYCEQGGIIRVKVKKTNEVIKICEECDSVWPAEVTEESGTTLQKYMHNKGCADSWGELEILERI